LTGKLTGDDTHDLKVVYAELAGYGDNLEAIPDEIAKSSDKLAAEISKMIAAEENVKRTETAQKNLSKLDKQTQRLYTAAMSGDVSNLTKAGAESIGGLDIRSLATTMGYEDIKDANGNTTKSAEQ
jgi:FKBP-type peptidyl-prolyl cis-trans isomerase